MFPTRIARFGQTFARVTKYRYSKNNNYNFNHRQWPFLLGLLISSGSVVILNDYSDVRFNIAKCLSEPKKPKNYRRISKEEVIKHNSKESGIWVTYKGKVYDITQFVSNHPGGDKILLAAGGDIEPFWELYAVHKDNAQVANLLKTFEIGELIENPNDKKKNYSSNDPFKYEPERHPALKIVCPKPFNAETPLKLIADNYTTPNSLFFVRNHLPVPDVDIKKYKLTIIDQNGKDIQLTYEDLIKMCKARSITTTIMCAGNKRSSMSKDSGRSVKGLSWGPGAISTAEWTGILLTDLLDAIGISENIDVEKVRHIQFEGMDKDMGSSMGYAASVPADIALDRRSEVLLAFKMNGQPLPLDHGFPVRLIVPGAVGARQVKWLNKITLADSESPGFWQQNDYKTFSPSVEGNMNFKDETAILEPNVTSTICSHQDGDIIKTNMDTFYINGYAWSGAGRGIIRVEVSVDGGKTWRKAEISDKSPNPHDSSRIYRQNWGWTLWEIDVPIPENVSSMDIVCKAVDSSQNTQPETYQGTWNARGLMANSWHRVTVHIQPEDNECT